MIRLFARRTPVGLAFTAFHLWRRLPPAQRRAVVAATRRHGPRLAAYVVKRRRV